MHKKLIVASCSSVAAAVLVFAGAAFAQSVGSGFAPAQGPGNNDHVPSWVFYWILGLSTGIGGALVATIKVLWTHATTDRDKVVGETINAKNTEIMAVRAQSDHWRAAAEAAERGRREDADRFRLEEREQLKLTIKGMAEVTEALRDNTRQIAQLVNDHVSGHD